MADSPGMIDRLFVAIEADLAPLMRGIQRARRVAAEEIAKISRQTKIPIAAPRGPTIIGGVAASTGVLDQSVQMPNVLKFATAIAATRTAFEATTDAIRAFKGDTEALHSALNKITFGIWGAGAALGYEISGQREEDEKIRRQIRRNEEETKARYAIIEAERKMSWLGDDLEAEVRIGELTGREAQAEKARDQLRRSLRQIDDSVEQMEATYRIVGRDLEHLNSRAERVRNAARQQAEQAISAIERRVGPAQTARESLIGQHYEAIWILKQLERNTRGERSYYPWVLHASGAN